MKESGAATDASDDTKDPSSTTPTFNLESAYGSVKPFHRPENFEHISRVAKDDKAERTVREME